MNHQLKTIEFELLCNMMADIETFIELSDRLQRSDERFVRAIREVGVPFTPSTWKRGKITAAQKMAYTRAVRRLERAGFITRISESKRDRTTHVRYMTKPNGPFDPSGPRPPGWPVSPFEPPKTPQLLPPDPPGSSSGSEGEEDDSSSVGFGPRPDWWPPYLDWPPKPSPPPEILYPPPIYTWPRLPVDHPYYLPPGYSWPNNLPPGHPGHNVPQPTKPNQA